MTVKKKKKNQKMYSKIAMVIIFLVGSLIMLYPFYIDALNNYLDQVRVTRYQKQQKEAYEAQQLQRSAENKKLAKTGFNPGADPFEAEAIAEHISPEVYEEHLIGTVNIPKLAVEMPLFDVTTASFLNIGATVLQGTSFPVGGLGTHAVITGHRGLPERELFTNLPKLSLGDLFLLTVLGETLAYEVDTIETVEPHETSSLKIDLEKDLVTLVTCTPYMINSHRLLVTGHRVPYTPAVEKLVEKGNQTRYLKQISILVGTFLIITGSITMLVRILLLERLKRTSFDLKIKLQNEKGAALQEQVQLFDRKGKKPLMRDGQPLIVTPNEQGVVEFSQLPGGLYQLYFISRKQKIKAGIKKKNQVPKIYATKFMKETKGKDLVVVLASDN